MTTLTKEEKLETLKYKLFQIKVNFPKNKSTLSSEQWCATGSNFAPQGAFGNVWKFLLAIIGAVCYWHLVGRGQGCC